MGFLPVVPDRSELTRGARLNIIQHPQGGPKRIAIRSNFYFDVHSTAREPDRLRYLTDTEPGSSGSPVVALHHAAVAIPGENYRGEVIKYNLKDQHIPLEVRDWGDRLPPFHGFLFRDTLFYGRWSVNDAGQVSLDGTGHYEANRHGASKETFERLERMMLKGK